MTSLLFWLLFFITPNQELYSFFNPWGSIEVSRNRLPHWQQRGATYFVTWRLADSIPSEKLARHRDEVAAWKSRHPTPWDEETELEFHRIFSGRMDRWMDAGYGTCLLREPLNSKVVRESLLHFEGARTMMISLVVMPNHVHTLFAIHPDWRLGEMVHSWKGYSSKRINALAKRSGALWQKDYFDRLVRDPSHFQNCVRYIRRNPEKAGLRKGEFILWENSLAAEVE